MIVPRADEAEESVIGAMMLSEKAIDAACGILEPEGATKFYSPTRGEAYAAALDMRGRGVGVDPLTLEATLRGRGVPDAELAKLRAIALSVFVSSNAAHHAELVREAWKKRETQKIASAALDAVTKQRASGDEMIEAMEAGLLGLRSRIERGRSSVTSLQEAVWDWARKTESPVEEEPGLPSPLGLPRFRDGRLYVLGGYTSDGKSTLALQCATTAAEAGKRVGIVTIEMSMEDVVERIITSEGIPYRQVATGRVEEEFRGLAVRTVRRLADLPIDVIDDEGANAAAIARFQALRRYEFLIIDHLHEIEWEERRALEQEIRGIRIIARKYEIPVLLLSQLRRESNFQRPTLSSFRDSAVIEQAAALAFCVWRERDERGLPTETAELIILKNRYGRTMTIPVRLVGSQVRFERRAVA